MSESNVSDVFISGVGKTDFTKSSGRGVDVLAHAACSAALDDAGISPSEVDGLITYPSGARAEDVIVPLGLENISFSAVSQMGGASSVGCLQIASAALASGVIDNALVVFARNGSSQARIASRVGDILPAPHLRLGLEQPLGLAAPAQMYAFMCQRHMHDYGTSREDLGRVALAMRDHAQRNPGAQMHGRTMTMQQYLDSRPIAVPYHLYDCSLETDGAVALVLTASPSKASGSSRRRVAIKAVSEGRPPLPDDFTNRRDFYITGLTKAAPRAFAAANVSPADIDVAMIYDCFTFEVLHQLEEAGFCERGESGSFVQSGAISLGGSLPVNPHGGLLSEGHVGGMSHIAEAVIQLRHEAGDRQVQDAELAVVTGWGDLGDGSIAILGRV
jgi:acetyl-CoA acetyltransferase